MAARGRTIAVLSTITIVLAVPSDAQTGHPEVELSLQNLAQASANVVDDAKASVVRIFRLAGIDVRWKEANADILVVIVPPPHPHIGDSRFALGYAPRTKLKADTVVFALADRIA